MNTTPKRYITIINNHINGDELKDCYSMLKNKEISESQMIKVLELFIEQQRKYASDLETKNIIEIMTLKKDIALLRAQLKRKETNEL